MARAEDDRAHPTPGQLGSELTLGARAAGPPIAGRGLHAPVEMDDRALLLGVGLSGEDQVGVLEDGLLGKWRRRSRCSRLQRPIPQLAVARSLRGSQRSRSRRSARRRPALRAISRAPRGASASGVRRGGASPARRRAARRPRAARVRSSGGYFQQPGALRAGQRELSGELEQSLEGRFAIGPRPEALVPQHDDLRADVAQLSAELLTSGARRSCAPAWTIFTPWRRCLGAAADRGSARSAIGSASSTSTASANSRSQASACRWVGILAANFNERRTVRIHRRCANVNGLPGNNFTAPFPRLKPPSEGQLIGG